MKYYEAKYIMTKEDETSFHPVDLWTFKSTKSKKRYIVEVEHFPNYFIGIKFFWKGVADSKQRYSLLTNDNEPRSIIMSCIHIMLRYYKHNNSVSFGFVAANNIDADKHPDSPNKRFRFYRRMMLSVFGDKTFLQCYDKDNSIYVLLNRSMLELGKISLHSVEKDIAKWYDGEYSLQPTR